MPEPLGVILECKHRDRRESLLCCFRLGIRSRTTTQATVASKNYVYEVRVRYTFRLTGNRPEVTLLLPQPDIGDNICERSSVATKATKAILIVRV